MAKTLIYMMVAASIFLSGCSEEEAQMTVLPEEVESEPVEPIEQRPEEEPEAAKLALEEKYIVKIIPIPPKEQIDHKMMIIRPDSKTDFKIQIIDPYRKKWQERTKKP